LPGPGSLRGIAAALGSLSRFRPRHRCPGRFRFGSSPSPCGSGSVPFGFPPGIAASVRSPSGSPSRYCYLSLRPVRVAFGTSLFRQVLFRRRSKQALIATRSSSLPKQCLGGFPFRGFLHPPCGFAFFPLPKLGAAGLPFGKWVRPWLSPLPRASSSWLALPFPSDAPLILPDIRRLFRRGNVLEPSSVPGLRRSRSAAPGHICKLTGRSESRQHNQPVDK